MVYNIVFALTKMSRLYALTKRNIVMKHYVDKRLIISKLTLYRPMVPSYRNQSTDWFLYDGDIGR